MSDSPNDLSDLRARLSGGRARTWRSLEEVADTASFRDFLAAEFPTVARLAAGPDRRHFLKLMGASFALAGLTGCDDDDGRDYEVPYVRNPARIQAGPALSYTSVSLIDGIANGVLVTTRNGRPIKIEGNPEHPWSRGGTDVFAQASVLGLYDPNRSQTVRYLGRPSSWQAFRAAMLSHFSVLRAQQGRGLRLLTGPLTSPAMIAQITGIQQALPQMHWHSFAPVDRTSIYDGTRAAFGRSLETRWRFERADVIISLDGEFLDPGPHQVGAARDWVNARHAAAARGALLSLHAAASVPTLTSAKADYHVAAGPQALAALAQGLLDDISGKGGPAATDPLGLWRHRAATALSQARGRSVVIAGPTLPVAVQALVHRLNDVLGNTGQTVFYTAPVVAPAEPFAALTAAMDAGAVDTLLMLDCNPAYAAPTDLGFAGKLARVPLKIHAGINPDETAAYADWHLPLAHPLESWGDARALDGTASLQQPTVAPLYGGLSGAEILSVLLDDAPRDGLALLRTYWQSVTPAPTFEARWRQALLDGFFAGTAFGEEAVQLAPAPPQAPAAAPAGTLTVLFRTDPTVWDGSIANNPWLQELPKPLTKVVWENVVGVSPRLAEKLQLAGGDVVAVEADGRRVEGPVWIMPGQSDDTVALTLGYGRSAQGLLSASLGYDAYALRNSADPWQRTGVTLTRTGRTVAVATTQDHSTMEGHDFVRVHAMGAPPIDDRSFVQPSLYPKKPNGDRSWGMVIDLDSCIGCNACVTACQSENNIPVVGREQVALGRELHWLRIDRYYEGTLDQPDTHFQPVPCMHCEDAPCEVGCPVEATLHDQEGLNLMVYNRCVGTRACSSYCPYKVRRFNYLDYAGNAAESVALQRNPDVTVRARGVMEKCTYCVQRVAEARIVADKDGRPIADGVVQTACQGACPTRAITFGNLQDGASAVTAARQDPRHYALLGELNVRPRTTYLAERAPAAGAKTEL